MRKKIVSLFTMFVVLLGVVASAPAVSVRAADVSPTPAAYQAVNKSMFGIAGDFGLFAQNDLTFNAHATSNFACGNLIQNGNIDHALATQGANGTLEIKKQPMISYAKTITRAAAIKGGNTGFFVVGSGVKIKQYAGNNSRWLVNNAGPIDYELEGLVKEGETTYIDLDAELEKLSALSATLSGMEDTIASSDVNILKDQNARTIKCSDDAVSVVTLKAEDIMKFASNDINFTNLTTSDEEKTVVVNVEFSSDFLKKKKSFSFPRIKVDGVSKNYNPNATKIIWNFGEFAGTIKNEGLSYGVVLATKAKVSFGQNHEGLVIAKNISIAGGEYHFVPYTGEENLYKPVSVQIESVNGTCCPSIPLANVTVALFNSDNKELERKTVSEVFIPDTKTNEGDPKQTFTAVFDIEDPGAYYIKVVAAPKNVIKTPIKCKFTVVADEDNVLTITKAVGKEANGESNAFFPKTNTYRLRSYENGVYFATLTKDFDETKATYTIRKFKDANHVVESKKTAAKYVEVEYTEDNPVMLYATNITATGYYSVERQYPGMEKETIDFVAYITPIGQLLIVECDNEYSDDLRSILGTPMTMKTYSSTKQKKLVALVNEIGEEYDVMTDGLVLFQ